jgi:hypothetical protein
VWGRGGLVFIAEAPKLSLPPSLSLSLSLPPPPPLFFLPSKADALRRRLEACHREIAQEYVAWGNFVQKWGGE